MRPEFEFAQVNIVVPGDSITARVHACGLEEHRIAGQLKLRKRENWGGVVYFFNGIVKANESQSFKYPPASVPCVWRFARACAARVPLYRERRTQNQATLLLKAFYANRNFVSIPSLNGAMQPSPAGHLCFAIHSCGGKTDAYGRCHRFT